MKLSEAMREGAKCHPPAIGAYFRSEPFHTQVIGTCALAACYEGTFGCQEHYPGENWLSELYEAYPVLRENIQTPDKEHNVTVDSAILDANDWLHWSRERIATWLEENDL